MELPAVTAARARHRAAPGQGLQQRGQIGLPQPRPLLVQLDGEDQFPRLIGRLANIEKGFLLNQIIQQRPKESRGAGELGEWLVTGDWLLISDT